MSYRAEKEKIEKKIAKIKIVVLCVVLAIVVGLCVFSAFCPPATWKYHVKKPTVTKRVEGEMRIHFLDVGQGDCTLIELPDGKVALIDGGNIKEDKAETVLRYLNALKIKTIDYLIVTHPDKDHCGALETVVKQKEILNAYLPATNPESEGSSYAGFYQELMEEDCIFMYSAREINMSGEGYTFAFLYPYSTDIEDLDAYDGTSSVLWLDYKGVSTLFMSDENIETENILMRDAELGMLGKIGVDLKSTEILKVGHHGSASSSSLEFLQYLGLRTAVISCGKNNPYNHPAKQVVDNLTSVGAGIYRTDLNGTVVVSVKSVEGYGVKPQID